MAGEPEFLISISLGACLLIQALAHPAPQLFSDQLHRAYDQSCMCGSGDYLQNIGKRQFFFRFENMS